MRTIRLVLAISLQGFGVSVVVGQPRPSDGKEVEISDEQKGFVLISESAGGQAAWPGSQW